jgi:hypothetical protein
MTDNHPITPPPELLQQWATEYWGNPGESIGCGEKHIATQAARSGADQELEACCEWVRSMFRGHPTWADELRAARRPKPPSLKEQALEALKDIECEHVIGVTTSTIRRALEALPND